MKTKKRIAAVFLAMTLTGAALMAAQTQRSRPQRESYEGGAFETIRDSRLIGAGVVRTINTAEATYKSEHGGFADWDGLYPTIIAAQNREPIANGVANGRGPEVVPGWILTLIVSRDGKTYQLSLHNLSDTKCPFSFFSDQNGLVYQGDVIGCEPAN